MDVQEALLLPILSHSLPSVYINFVSVLERLAVSFKSSISIDSPHDDNYQSSVEIDRKLWALIADMLEEMDYVKTTLASDINTGNQQIENFKLSPLGSAFCSLDWIQLNVLSLQTITTGRLLQPTQNLEKIDTALRSIVRASIFNRLSALAVMIKHSDTVIWQSNELINQIVTILESISSLNDESDENISTMARSILETLSGITQSKVVPDSVA